MRDPIVLTPAQWVDRLQAKSTAEDARFQLQSRPYLRPIYHGCKKIIIAGRSLGKSSTLCAEGEA